MSCSSDSREIGCGSILVWVERIKKSFGGIHFDDISLHSELGHVTHKKTPYYFQGCQKQPHHLVTSASAIALMHLDRSKFTQTSPSGTRLNGNLMSKPSEKMICSWFITSDTMRRCRRPSMVWKGTARWAKTLHKAGKPRSLSISRPPELFLIE